MQVSQRGPRVRARAWARRWRASWAQELTWPGDLGDEVGEVSLVEEDLDALERLGLERSHLLEQRLCDAGRHILRGCGDRV